MLLKFYRRKGYNFKKVIIVGAGKNGMELYRVMKDDISSGFNILGFFDDNLALKDILPNYLGTTDQVENMLWKRILMRSIVRCREQMMRKFSVCLISRKRI